MRKYTKEEIFDGVKCWLDPDNDVWCEKCAFHKESNGEGKCRAAVFREVKKFFESTASECDEK